MRSVLRWLTVVVAASLALLLSPGIAQADDDTPRSWNIPRYEATAVFAKDGTAEVTLDFDFDFSRDPGHGPFITLPERQRVTGDPDVWRMIDLEIGKVSSGTGAATDMVVFEEDGNLVVRVGHENKTWTGVQNYRITYRVRGLVDPDNEQSGLDEVNWQAIGPGWRVPIKEALITIEGPVASERVACWSGRGNESECDAEQKGKKAHFEAFYLQPGEMMQTVAGYKVGTFVGAEPRYTKRHHFGNMFPLTPVSGVLTGLASVLGIGMVVNRTRRGARDEVYLGLTPGLTPLPGQEATVGKAGRVDAPVAVQFSPPRGARPGELGVLQDSTADNVDITATIIDLAVRGHITITEVGKKRWAFTYNPNVSDHLTEPEQFAIRTMFKKQQTVTTKDLRKERYGDLMPGIRSRLYQRVTRDLRWFKSNPQSSRAGAFVLGLGLLLAGPVIGWGLGRFLGLGLVGLAFVITGLVVILMKNKFGARTADGSAMLAQSKGFEQYLSTAEADQIRFEEGIDVFSRYLPYAIVFGVADRWARVFQQLAAQGRYVATTGWYVGSSPVYDSVGFGRAMNSLNTTLSSSMQSAVSASNAQSTGGGSGFSGGGGGFGGGGGGGW